MPDFHLTILGCGSALPARGRMPSSQHLKVGKYSFLIDCGEGTQHLLRKYKLKLQGITHIFISHMHGDHFLGLMGLLFSMTLLGREKKVVLVGPSELKELIELHLKHAKAGLKFDIEYVFTQAEEKATVIDLPNVIVESVPLDHKIATTGYLFTEKVRPRKLRADRLEYHKVPLKVRGNITKGADFEKEDGSVISNMDLTEDPIPPLSYAYCSDTAYKESLLKDLKGVHVLFHESTFMEQDADRAKRTRHSTAKQAASIAEQLGVDRLILGHYSARYDDLDLLLNEAKSIFPQSYLSYEGMTLDFHRDS